VHAYFRIARARGAHTHKTPLYNPTYNPCPKNEILFLCRMIRPLTRRSLITNQMPPPLQISKSPLKTARPVTIVVDTNEVAIWALQLYIGLFTKLPLTILGAHSVRFSICLQPRDQHPVIYITIVPGPLFILSPRGTIFSYPGQVRMHIFTLIKYMLISSILFKYCSRWVFGFHVCRYLIIIHRHNPFRYILGTGM
jgi:hypothetical protein